MQNCWHFPLQKNTTDDAAGNRLKDYDSYAIKVFFPDTGKPKTFHSGETVKAE